MVKGGRPPTISDEHLPDVRAVAAVRRSASASETSVAASSQSNGDLERLRQYVTGEQFGDQAQLPAERDLADEFELTRGRLRTCLAKLEQEGIIWRHVGKGTFVGRRPGPNALGNEIGTNPIDVMKVRIFIEPELARQAALMATPDAIDRMWACLARMTDQRFEIFESWDRRLHHEVARASNSPLLLAMFELIQANRHRSMGGMAKRAYMKPERLVSAYAEHKAIVDAIADRDPAAACAAMRQHLHSVSGFLFAE